MEKEFQIQEDESGRWILISAFRLRLGDEIKQAVPGSVLKEQSSFEVRGIETIHVAEGICSITGQLRKMSKRLRLTVNCNPGSWYGYIYPTLDIMTTITASSGIISRGWEKVWLKIGDAS